MAQLGDFSKPTQYDASVTEQLLDVVRPELQHLAPLRFVLGPVVDAAHAADGVVHPSSTPTRVSA